MVEIEVNLWEIRDFSFHAATLIKISLNLEKGLNNIKFVFNYHNHRMVEAEPEKLKKKTKVPFTSHHRCSP